jgi:hypothetical protein
MKKSAVTLSRLTLLAFLAAPSCGPAPFKPAKRVTIKPSSYSYEFNGQGCKTGKHSFRTEDEYCRALMDDELNNHCARSQRENTYNSQCRQ